MILVSEVQRVCNLIVFTHRLFYKDEYEATSKDKLHFVEQRLYVRNHAKCFTHLVFCDCGFHSVCPLRDKDQRPIEKKRKKEKIAHLIEYMV